MRALLLLVPVVLTGCLAAPDPAGDPGSGIRGVAMIGPTCPVERDPPDPDCADRPYEGQFAVTTGDGEAVVTTFSTDAQGRFNVSLPAGDYAIRLADASRALPRCASSEPVTVRAAAWVLVEIDCDSGIR